MLQLSTVFTSTAHTEAMGALSPLQQIARYFRVWRDMHGPDNAKLISKSWATWCAWNHIECREKRHWRCLWRIGILFARLGSNGKQQHSINSQERERGMCVSYNQLLKKPLPLNISPIPTTAKILKIASSNLRISKRSHFLLICCQSK